MSPLLQEINTLIQTSLETVASDPDYDNSLLALDAYSQQIEDYLDVLEEMIRAMGTGVRRLRGKQRQFEALAGEADHSARQFSREGQSRLSKAAASRTRVMHQAAEAFRQEADAQNERFRVLMDAKLRLEARLTQVAQHRTLLQMAQGQDQARLLPV